MAAKQAVLNVLKVNASSRYEDSVTRRLTATFVNSLENHGRDVWVRERDLAQGLPYVSESWIQANFTAADQRNQEQTDLLALSDKLVNELQQADLLVLGVPLYNFGIPASLKAWIDLVARAGLTFRYTSEGPEGLLKNKKAVVIVATGGTPVGGNMDFASNYLKHVLGFIGIEDVTVIAADRLGSQFDDSFHKAEQQVLTTVSRFAQAA